MIKFKRNKYAFSKAASLLSVGKEFDKKRGEQLSLLRKEVYLYDVHIKELSKLNPTYDVRNLMLNLAFFIMNDVELLEILNERRKLNISLLSRKTRIGKNFIDKWSKYIIFYTILFSNPNYKFIQDYFRIVDLEKTNSSQSLNVMEEEQNSKGLVIKKNEHSINLLTSTGEIIKTKKVDVEIGQEHYSSGKSFFKKNKLKLFLGFIIIMVLVGGFFYQYNKKITTIMIHTTSQIKMETNRFNKVLYSYSKTEKGEALLNEIKPNGENLDTAILDTIKYAEKNKMMPEKGLLITINGTSVNIKTLKKTGEYIYKNKINVDINNNGIQHKLYTIIKNQKEED